MARLLTMCFVSVLAAAASAQQTGRAPTPPPESDPLIVKAETAAQSFPFVGRTPPARTCTIVKPDQIGFPSSTGDPAAFNLFSGEFTAGSLTFGWDKTYEQGKMPLTPRYSYQTDGKLQLELTRLSPRGERLVQTYSALGNGSFATWPKFSTPGKWMIVATAGVNWGCFVFDRPVKATMK